jgi:hypothetical protein
MFTQDLWGFTYHGDGNSWQSNFAVLLTIWTVIYGEHPAVYNRTKLESWTLDVFASQE